MPRRYAVIGLGQYGLEIATQLAEKGADVTAIDVDPAVIERVKAITGILALRLDATDRSALLGAGIEGVKAAVVAIGSQIEASIIVTSLLHDHLNVDRIVARASSHTHARILSKVGANDVHNPEVDMARQDADALLAATVRSRDRLPTGHQLIEIDTLQHQWTKRLSELRFRARRLIPIAIRRNAGLSVDAGGGASDHFEIDRFPGDDSVIEKGDVIVLLGDPKAVREFLARPDDTP